MDDRGSFLKVPVARESNLTWLFQVPGVQRQDRQAATTCMETTNWKALATACAAEASRRWPGPCGVGVHPKLELTIFYQNEPFPYRHKAVAAFERALEDQGVTRLATVTYPLGGPDDGKTVLCLIQGRKVDQVRRAWRP